MKIQVNNDKPIEIEDFNEWVLSESDIKLISSDLFFHTITEPAKNPLLRGRSVKIRRIVDQEQPDKKKEDIKPPKQLVNEIKTDKTIKLTKLNDNKVNEIKRGRKLKYDEPTKLFAVKVPISKFDQVVKLVNDFLGVE